MSQRILGAILLAICIALTIVAWDYRAPFSYEPVGPRAYPLLLLGLLIGGTLYLLFKPVSDVVVEKIGHDEDVPMDRQMLIKVSACVLLLVAYAALFEKLGFVLSTLPFGFFIARLYGARWWQGAVTGILASISLYLLFDYALDVPLPLGVLQLLEN